MIETTGPDYGHPLDSNTIEQGLRALNSGFHFDLAEKIGQVHPYIAERQGVYYEGRHICSMDRGMVPEYKLWTVSRVLRPIPWADADKDGASIMFFVVPQADPEYQDLLIKAKRGNDPAISLRNDGKIVRQVPMNYIPEKTKCLRLGWRHTFERILIFGVQNVTRQSLGATFGIDMLKYPVGEPEEVVAALMEE